jgi:hypothetical protein
VSIHLAYLAGEAPAGKSDARRAIILGLFIYDAIGFIATLIAVISGLLNPLGWLSSSTCSSAWDSGISSSTSQIHKHGQALSEDYRQQWLDIPDLETLKPAGELRQQAGVLNEIGPGDIRRDAVIAAGDEAAAL